MEFMFIVETIVSILLRINITFIYYRNEAITRIVTVITLITFNYYVYYFTIVSAR